MSRAWILVLVAVALLAGCDGGGGGAGTAAEPEAVPPDSRPPGEVLLAFVEAAGEGDAEAMWALLSPDTRERFGGSLEAFREGTAAELEEGVGAFARTGEARVVLEEELAPTVAVATVAGQRTVEGMEEQGAYAAPLRLVNGSWRVSIGGEPQLVPRSPEPGASVEGSPVVTVAVSTTEIEEAVMWIDDATLPSLELTSEGTVTGTLGIPLAPGTHVATALAVTVGEVSAVAWTFEVA